MRLLRKAARYRLEDTCRRCRGAQYVPRGRWVKPCPRCKGKGFVVKMVRAG